MSAWLVGLAVGAGYLINKNLSMNGILLKAEQRYNNAAGPSTDGVTSEEVRTAWANTDFAKYGDMHEDLSTSQKSALLAKQERQLASVEAYESVAGQPEIRGVLLTYDRLGPA